MSWKVFQEINGHWARIFTAKSFDHACRKCRELQAKFPCCEYCVNS